MRERGEGDHKIIVIPMAKPKRELAPWEFDLQLNASLLDPYKNLLPQKLQKTENTTPSNADHAIKDMNFKSFFSNDSQLGDVPAEIPSFSSFHEDFDNPQLAAFSSIANCLKPCLPTEEVHILPSPKVSKGKKKLQVVMGIQQQQSNNRRTKNSKVSNEQIQSMVSSSKTSCKCKKSKCLKMYCQCFIKGNSCGDNCQCIGCDNISISPSPKKRFRGKKPIEQKTKSTNKKLQTSQLSPLQVGCNCRKTQCMKKYCQCYNSGAICSFNCKCQGCLNQEEQ